MKALTFVFAFALAACGGSIEPTDPTPDAAAPACPHHMQARAVEGPSCRVQLASGTWCCDLPASQPASG